MTACGKWFQCAQNSRHDPALLGNLKNNMKFCVLGAHQFLVLYIRGEVTPLSHKDLVAVLLISLKMVDVWFEVWMVGLDGKSLAQQSARWHLACHLACNEPCVQAKQCIKYSHDK